MYQPDPLETVRSMVQLFHVRLHLFKQPYQHLEELDFHLRQHLYHDYNYDHLLASLKSDLKEGTTHSERDIFDNWYCAFPLSTAEETVPPPYEFAVLGPYRYTECTEKDAEVYLQKAGLPEYLKEELLFAIHRVPVIVNRSAWVNMQVTLIAPLITHDRNLKYRTLMDMPEDFSAYEPVQTSDNEEYQRLSLAGGYTLEQRLEDAVIKNQVGQAGLIGFQYLSFQVQYHRQYGLSPAHALTALNTLLRHAALEAGVNALRLDAIYVRYERKFLENDDKLLDRMGCVEMISDYCKLVEQYAYPNFSLPVRQSIDYIDFHYNENISLHTLAAMLNISDGYLSASFHKETGVSLTAYIQTTRINHACFELESSDLSVQQIGMNCGYPDASYFTRIFKKEKGVSPLKYRMQRRML